MNDGKQGAVKYLREKLAELSPETTMVTIGIEAIQNAIEDASFDYKQMVAAAQDVKGFGFDLTPRSSDDFSSTPYLWITPRPQPLDPNIRHTPPEMCWMGANANGGGPARIKEGVLIFTKEGYAYGALVKLGIGDIDVRQIPWKKIVDSRSEKAAVLDYAEGLPIIIIPIE